MSAKLHYHLLNSFVPEAARRTISGAGAFGAQHLTPLLDTHYLLSGESTLEAEGRQLSVFLDTGSVSPIVPVRALLQQARAQLRVELAHVSVHNLGINMPRCTLHFAKTEDPISVWEVLSPVSAQELRRHATTVGLAHVTVAPGTEETRNDTTHIIAECVPGGTTTAATLLSLIADQPVLTPSSSMDEVVAREKAAYVQQLYGQYKQRGFYYSALQSEAELDATLDQTTDLFQHYLFYLLEALSYVPQRALPQNILLGGGSQMVAVAALFARVYPFKAMMLSSIVRIVTTPWVWNTPEFQAVLSYAQPFRVSAATDFSFTAQDPYPYQLFERGYTKEGCGLGALLWYLHHLCGVPVERLRHWCAEALPLGQTVASH